MSVQGIAGGTAVPVTGTFSATIGGFTPTPGYANLAVGAVSSRVALPTGTVIIVYNTGANAAYIQLGGSGVTATTGNDVIQPGSWLAFTVGSSTYLAGIETAGATNLNISGGAGLPTGAGGGSAGGAGGTITGPLGHGTADASAVSVVPSATASFPVTGTFWQTTQPVSGTFWQATQPVSLATAPTTPVTGTFWQATQPVSIASLPALATGSNTIGKVDILGGGGATLDTAAGTPATQALGIQGVTGGVAVPVTGTLSASIGAFAPTPGYASLSVSAASSRVALPTGADVIVTNVGANPAYVLLGNGSVTATTSDDILQPNQWMEYAVGSNVDLAAITASSTTTLTLSGGAGIAAGSIGPLATQPISGTVTANAGTNLNTSALALESGGNLATIAGASGSLLGGTAGATALQ